MDYQRSDGMIDEEFCQRLEILVQIIELEERILSATPSDNWAIGEKSILPPPLTIVQVSAPVAKL